MEQWMERMLFRSPSAYWTSVPDDPTVRGIVVELLNVSANVPLVACSTVTT